MISESMFRFIVGNDRRFARTTLWPSAKFKLKKTLGRLGTPFDHLDKRCFVLALKNP